MLLDLAVLLLLALAALHGAAGGALRQLVQLCAAVVGWLAARHLSAPVASGLGRTVPGFLARAGAPVLLFLGAFALVSLVGALALRGTSVARVVRGPTDRGAGAILGGMKGALVAWVLLSALSLAGGLPPGRLASAMEGSEYVTLVRAHNLLVEIDPEKARLLERVLRAARLSEKEGAGAPDGEAARALLKDPRLRALADSGGRIDSAEAARLLDDPRIRELVEKVREREGPPK